MNWLLELVVRLLRMLVPGIYVRREEPTTTGLVRNTDIPPFVPPQPPEPVPPVATYGVSGWVSLDGISYSGVSVYIPGAGTYVSALNGTYTGTLPEDFSGTATPQAPAPGGSVYPSVRVYSLVNSDQAGQGYDYTSPPVLPGFAPSGLTAALPIVPEMPTHLHTTFEFNGSGTLAWNDNSDNESGFYVERREITASPPYPAFVRAGTVAANGTTFGYPAQEISREFQVIAFNSYGTSYPSNRLEILPAPPAAPSDLTGAIIGPNQIDLMWTDNSTSAYGFNVEREDNGSGIYNPLSGSGTPAYSDLTVSAANSYNYRVYAIGPGGSSAYSNIFFIAIP